MGGLFGEFLIKAGYFMDAITPFNETIKLKFKNMIVFNYSKQIVRRSISLLLPRYTWGDIARY
jgi:hypothetical protein